MGKLYAKFLPSSPDCSGVCSAIFDLDCVAVTHDVPGRTGNYTGCGRPRWCGSKTAIFCSGLHKVDAILGGDEKMIQEVLDAAGSLNPELTVLIGSSVPMVIGIDMEGIAVDIEARTGIPYSDFGAIETRYYSDGITKAYLALMERFAQTPGQKMPDGVGLLGLIPLGFEGGVTSSLKVALTQNGLELVSGFCSGLTMETIQNAAQASLNLVVLQPGLQPARSMEQRFGIPHLVQIPVGRKAQENWLEAIHNCLSEQKSLIPCAAGGETDILVLGDGVLYRNVQLGLEADFGLTADCGCLFGIESKLSETNILNLKDEQKIEEAINCGKYRRAIGDLMLRMLIHPETEVDPFDLPLHCISNKMSDIPSVNCTRERFNAFLTEIR